MPSFTTWTRIDSRSQSADTSESLRERVHDPFWLLARQWQHGEFRGHDGGSPIQASLRTEHAQVNRFCAGDSPFTAGNAEPYDAALPLEALVERESVRGGPSSPRQSAEAGLRLLRMLDAKKLAAYRAPLLATYPFAPRAPGAPPPAGDDERLLAALQARAPDGARAAAAMSSNPLAPFSNAPASDRDALTRVVRQWLLWYRALFSEPTPPRSSWITERLEYRFAVAAAFNDREVVLQAPDFRGTRLDWHTFDVAPGASLGAPASVTADQQTVVPSPITFRGMPPSRCWELEDAGSDFGSVDAGPTDLARPILLDFALIYGNDWFVMPVRTRVGAITRVSSLVVTDTFGTRVLLRSVAEVAVPGAPWSAFNPGGDARLLLVPPTAIQPLRGEPLEEVLLLRDDGADVAWAVERIIESANGSPVKRESDAIAPLRDDGSGDIRYRIASSVPSNWIPLVPIGDGGARRLVRGTVLPGDERDQTRVLGALLEPGTRFALSDEEVPREGSRLRRAFRYARWLQGATALWVARARTIGRGEGASHLEYDLIEKLPPVPPTP